MTVGRALSDLTSILNVLRNTAYTGIATPFVQLHTADPGAAGATAVSVGDATRKAIAWNAPSGSNPTQMLVTAAVSGWTNGGTSETLTHISIWTAVSAGTFILSILLTASQAWVSTNTFTLNTCTLGFTPTAA
jgi:hypothetical protein